MPRESAGGGAGASPKRSRAMTRTRWALGGLAIGLTAMTLTGNDPESKAGSDGSVSGTLGSLWRRVCNTTENLSDGWNRARSTVTNDGLVQQIGTRLHQDKTLGEEDIQITIEDETTVVLKGLVPDAACKEKAVALARDTRGVERVVDHLAVMPRPRVISAGPADDTDASEGSGVAVIEIPSRRR